MSQNVRGFKIKANKTKSDIYFFVKEHQKNVSKAKPMRRWPERLGSLSILS